MKLFITKSNAVIAWKGKSVKVFESVADAIRWQKGDVKGLNC